MSGESHGSFSFFRGTCPYAGSSYFSGLPITAGLIIAAFQSVVLPFLPFLHAQQPLLPNLPQLPPFLFPFPPPWPPPTTAPPVPSSFPVINQPTFDCSRLRPIHCCTSVRARFACPQLCGQPQGCYGGGFPTSQAAVSSSPSLSSKSPAPAISNSNRLLPPLVFPPSPLEWFRPGVQPTHFSRPTSPTPTQPSTDAWQAKSQKGNGVGESQGGGGEWSIPSVGFATDQTQILSRPNSGVDAGAQPSGIDSPTPPDPPPGIVLPPVDTAPARGTPPLSGLNGRKEEEEGGNDGAPVRAIPATTSSQPAAMPTTNSIFPTLIAWTPPSLPPLSPFLALVTTSPPIPPTSILPNFTEKLKAGSLIDPAGQQPIGATNKAESPTSPSHITNNGAIDGEAKRPKGETPSMISSGILRPPEAPPGESSALEVLAGSSNAGVQMPATGQGAVLKSFNIRPSGQLPFSSFTEQLQLASKPTETEQKGGVAFTSEISANATANLPPAGLLPSAFEGGIHVPTAHLVVPPSLGPPPSEMEHGQQGGTSLRRIGDLPLPPTDAEHPTDATLKTVGADKLHQGTGSFSIKVKPSPIHLQQGININSPSSTQTSGPSAAWSSNSLNTSSNGIGGPMFGEKLSMLIDHTFGKEALEKLKEYFSSSERRVPANSGPTINHGSPNPFLPLLPSVATTTTTTISPYTSHLVLPSGPSASGWSSVVEKTCGSPPDYTPCVSSEVASKRLLDCCRSKAMPPGCLSLCRYNVTQKEVRAAFDSNRCGILHVVPFLQCASQGKNNLECCRHKRIAARSGPQCEVFCHPADGLGPLGLQHLACQSVISDLLYCHHAGIKE